MNPNEYLLKLFAELERLVDGHGTRHAISTTGAGRLEVHLGAGDWYWATQVALDDDPIRLLPLAEEGFDLASLHFPQINASGCARALTNFYSAPLPVGTAVQVKVYSAYVEIWYQAKCV